MNKQSLREQLMGMPFYNPGVTRYVKFTWDEVDAVISLISEHTKKVIGKVKKDVAVSDRVAYHKNQLRSKQLKKNEELLKE